MNEGIATEEEFEHLIGQTLDGRYLIEEVLGTGGMGGVLRAQHVGLKNDVAVKVLRARFGHKGETAKRFEREAHSASRLDHPNCVRVTDFGSTPDGGRYLVMPFLDGEELYDLLGTPWAPTRAVDLASQMFQGLAHAHRQGIVHRDLKPANVYIIRDDRDRETVKLVDFGIAKLINDSVFEEKLTRAGVIFGTPRYMSPEQASGGKVDARTDVYSAGLLLYQMLAGHPPFEADGAPTLLRMHMIAPPPPLPDGVPVALRELVMRMLEKLPSDRPQTADEVVDALEAIRPTVEGVLPAHKVATNADEATVEKAVRKADDATHTPSGLSGSLSRPLAALAPRNTRRGAEVATNPYGWAAEPAADGATPPPVEGGTPVVAPIPQPPTGPTRGHTVRAIPAAPPKRDDSDNTVWYLIAGCVGVGTLVAVVMAFVMWGGDDAEATAPDVAGPAATAGEQEDADDDGPEPDHAAGAEPAGTTTESRDANEPKRTPKKKGKGKGKGKGKKKKKKNKPWELEFD